MNACSIVVRDGDEVPAAVAGINIGTVAPQLPALGDETAIAQRREVYVVEAGDDDVGVCRR
jgi:hypothetical protein